VDIGKPKRRIKSDPISPPVPAKEPSPRHDPVPVEPERSPEPVKEPVKVYADPDTYAFEGWPEGHPVAEALKRLR